MDLIINDKSYYVKFNQLALEVYTDNLDFNSGGVSAIYSTIFAGITGGAYVKRLELDLTFEDICDFVDIQMQTEEGIKLITEVCNSWTDTLLYQKWIKEVRKTLGINDEEEVKKK